MKLVHTAARQSTLLRMPKLNSLSAALFSERQTVFYWTIYRTQHPPFTAYDHPHLNRVLTCRVFPDTSNVSNPLDCY